MFFQKKKLVICFSIITGKKYSQTKLSIVVPVPLSKKKETPREESGQAAPPKGEGGRQHHRRNDKAKQHRQKEPKPPPPLQTPSPKNIHTSKPHAQTTHFRTTLPHTPPFSSPCACLFSPFLLLSGVDFLLLVGAALFLRLLGGRCRPTSGLVGSGRRFAERSGGVGMCRQK